MWLQLPLPVGIPVSQSPRKWIVPTVGDCPPGGGGVPQPVRSSEADTTKNAGRKWSSPVKLNIVTPRYCATSPPRCERHGGVGSVWQLGRGKVVIDLRSQRERRHTCEPVGPKEKDH